MAYLAVNKDGTEVISQGKPILMGEIIGWYDWEEIRIELPSGSIEKLIGRTLTWEDEPVEI